MYVGMEESLGYIEGEQCNRNGCTGVLYMKEQNGECTCHMGHPPCSFCVNSIGCCSKCEWNETDSLNTRFVMIEKIMNTKDKIKFYRRKYSKYNINVI